jgi:hypothetical protein
LPTDQCCPKRSFLRALAVAACVFAISPVFARAAETPKAKTATIVSAGKTGYVVYCSEPSDTQSFAMEELIRYVDAMTGVKLPSRFPKAGEKRILLDLVGDAATIGDGYSISVRNNGDVVLGGTGRRSHLFAVYDLLERLGCRWLAPRFAFYNGNAEYVPKKDELKLAMSDAHVIEAPAFKIRKLDVEEGLSHDAENLKQLIEWAPKLRYNTLMVPRDYGGRGRVTWDKWRDAITPECKKRGLIIEVGGHGYENFINAEMQNGALFKNHPEWFGLDEAGKRSKQQKRVFCTSNPAAVEFFTNSVLEYLASHPEVDVFELWPPDGASWCACDACKALGEPPDRQALLVNHVQEVVKKSGRKVRLEIIAYSKALLPPAKVKLDKRILVDYCPINQSFESPIDDPANSRNADYAAAVTKWRKEFAGDIGLYSYYRKYAWRSLPALIPFYMQKDLQFYHGLPLQALSTYCEPGDWGTYELNHYSLGKLAWNVDADVSQVSRDFCAARFGAEHADVVARSLVLLGDSVRSFGNLPFTRLKSAAEIQAAIDKLQNAAKSLPKDTRLELIFEYALRDLRIQHARAGKAPEADLREQVKSLAKFLADHKDEGVFIQRGESDRIFSRYGVKP